MVDHREDGPHGPTTFRERPKLKEGCFRAEPTTPPLCISDEKSGDSSALTLPTAHKLRLCSGQARR
jgi:hypothetical protein